MREGSEYLIDREGEDAEHEMAFDFDGAAHARELGAELVLESGVDALDRGRKS